MLWTAPSPTPTTNSHTSCSAYHSAASAAAAFGGRRRWAPPGIAISITHYFGRARSRLATCRGTPSQNPENSTYRSRVAVPCFSWGLFWNFGRILRSFLSGPGRRRDLAARQWIVLFQSEGCHSEEGQAIHFTICLYRSYHWKELWAKTLWRRGRGIIIIRYLN